MEKRHQRWTDTKSECRAPLHLDCSAGYRRLIVRALVITLNECLSKEIWRIWQIFANLCGAVCSWCGDQRSRSHRVLFKIVSKPTSSVNMNSANSVRNNAEIGSPQHRGQDREPFSRTSDTPIFMPIRWIINTNVSMFTWHGIEHEWFRFYW